MKKSNEFHFGATSVMREVPPGQTAVIKFNGKLEEIETEWGNSSNTNGSSVERND